MISMNLDELRCRIDAVDDELIDLFASRMALSRQVAEYKKANDLPVADSKREADILRRLMQKVDPELSPYAESFFGGLFALSRSYQNSFLYTYGLVGGNLSYSYSKIIHEMLGDYEYELFSLNAEEFETLMRSRNFDGLNITTPYKKAAISFCDEVSEVAREIGAVNTIYKKDGRLVGANTDYDGFLYTLNRSGISLKNKKVLILGAGGASLAIRRCASEEGALKISVAGRNHDFSGDYDAEIIINATPVGTFPEIGGKIIDLADFHCCEGVIDVVYNPLYTDLLLRARELGIAYSNGLPMLVAQAAAAASLFTGKSYTDMNEIILERLVAAIQNIVLIGMPGAGKSTLGKKLAIALGRDFIDLDEVISEKAGMSVPDIFEKFGEKHFRDMETNAAEEYGRRHGLIIATGGGFVLREENMDAIRRNAVVFHLDKPIELLDTKGRPLSKDIETLKKMYEERQPLYERYGDYTWKERCTKQ